MNCYHCYVPELIKNYALRLYALGELGLYSEVKIIFICLKGRNEFRCSSNKIILILHKYSQLGQFDKRRKMERKGMMKLTLNKNVDVAFRPPATEFKLKLWL